MRGVAGNSVTIRAFAAADAVIIVAMICAALAAGAFLGAGRPDVVTVFRQNAVAAEYPLGADAAFTVNGLLGPLDIEIKNGTARIIHANCPKKICRQSGGISNSHGQLICAPNNVMIQIRSSKSGNGVDGVAY